MTKTPPTSAPPAMPEKIGAYKIESILDKGGTSLLYLGINPETKEPLVVKVLSSKYLSDPKMVERFLHEAEVIQLTNHPNIIKLYGHGKWEGGAYIATEFIQGISLRQMILQEAMSLRRAVEIILQIAHGLTHLHAHGIIHRDLKPENILLTAQGGVKIIDFGISYAETTGKEGINPGLGTPAYTSPEMRKDPSNASFSSDVYSLGLIAYELILGRLSHGKVHIHLIPKGLQTILANALQPDVSKRYEDIVDFVQAMTKYSKSDAMKKDLRGSDVGGELRESLRDVQAQLIPNRLPAWNNINMGFASNSNMAISAVYFDFFEKKEQYHIVIGESHSTGVEGLFHMAYLKGLVHALAMKDLPPRDFVNLLNEALMDGSEKRATSFIYLTLIPRAKKCAYIACGDVPLWRISSGKKNLAKMQAKNPSLGVERGWQIIEADANWEMGDSLILVTQQAGLASESKVKGALESSLFLPASKQAEAVFRKLLQKQQNTHGESSLAVICIEKKN
jgi:eukaryotic-like serine/threonine-protein kinase